MFKKGIALYLGFDKYSLSKNLEYLKKAKAEGYETVFSSIHINEANPSLEQLQLLIDEMIRLDMKLSLDISKKVYDLIKLPTNLYALRLDYGFKDEELITMSQTCPYKLDINASTIREETFLKLVEKGLNLSKIKASFNFYPKVHSGHSLTFCEEKIKFFHQFGIEVAAFLPSHSDFRPPMFEGLPTIENHRQLDLHLAIEELKALGVDEIIFADAYASIDELKTLSAHQKEELLVDFISATNFQDIDQITGLFKIRPDLSEEVLRISSRKKTAIAPFNTIARHPLDVTIDNDLFLRYAGEINIVLTNLDADERVNVIGHLHTTPFIIHKLQEGCPFSFIKK